ncbi:MAG: hypothetical protein F6K36_02230 [Symploca sp. SIO3C6]|uniref:Cell division protein FtsL n=1 Tax=Symploca sp. SIO1C4 TaxID=2607765 RepID=A0A6B3NRC7_9CYAN|nr:hypothetical protein [Symploca sp. SIO3C6]NER32051.1 hypothetical protein [Symploca sp. SIO1C4]NET05704.1 hypothetical protein [Symploca sp. SIO2B6]NET51389.1 hypothetical protein [Merismopedia sp. SIO2A8]
MHAASRPDLPPTNRSKRLTNSSDNRLKVARINPWQRTMPNWLQSLLFLQRSSDLISVLLVGATLSIYSWTVWTQQQWTREYRKLETLQRQERDLTSANETLKEQLAQQAESPASGLVNPTTANTIFLPPAKERKSQAVPKPKTSQQPAATIPLGY